jgi:uncharacterized protein (TIGR02270 family)
MTASPSKPEPLWDLVEESLEEAAFLWKRWQAELHSLERNLDEVWSWTEDRLHGALDGVRVAGDSIPRLVEPLLAGDDPAILTVCAHLLAAGSPGNARALLATTIGAAAGPRLWSMIRGIEVADLDGTFAPVTTTLAAKGPEHSAALCRLRAFRRSTPARELADAFASNIPALQVEALRALGHAAADSPGRYIDAALNSDDSTVRRAAIECGVRRRLPNAWAEGVRLAHERHPESGPLLAVLAVLGDADEHQAVIAALREPGLQHDALFALGYIGTPEAVEICLAGMRDPKFARGAGEAYCAITGAHLQRDNLAAAEPSDIASPPPLKTDDLEAELVPAAHDLWPLPDVEAVRRHWTSRKSSYSAGVRYLRGRPVDLSVLIDAIETGPMLRRPNLILEVTVRTAGRYDVESRAFVRVQRRMMAAGRVALADRGPR